MFLKKWPLKIFVMWLTSIQVSSESLLEHFNFKIFPKPPPPPPSVHSLEMLLSHLNISWPLPLPNPVSAPDTVYVFWTISVGPTLTPFTKWLCKKIAWIVAINVWNIYYQPCLTIYRCLSLDFWTLSTISRPIYTSTKAISCFSESKNGARKVASMASSYKTNLKRHLFVK